MDVAFIIIFIVFIIFSSFCCIFKENLFLCCFLNIIGVHYAILRFLPPTDSVATSASDSGETAISSAKPECGPSTDSVAASTSDSGEAAISSVKSEVGPSTLWESSPTELLKFSTSLAAPELKTAFSASGDAASSKAFSSCPTTNWIVSTKANENTTKGTFTMFYVFLKRLRKKVGYIFIDA
ncbi:hypothetical protein ES288_D01G015500v1 [Gossypium darwinii]|uniref:Uncharacterized protein n=1 Tax=Gossypium darwinii TaxID=34276 RepID=A0A5D2DLG8_GOSDA|nr:hypothetical protein ES288_D01G015500v1 [Gossypium darwinii]